MGRTACTEPQCLYKGTAYLLLTYEDENIGKRLEAFAGTDFNENYSDRQSRQNVKILRRLGNYPHSHLQGVLVVW